MEISGKSGIESSDNISGAFYKSGSGVNLQSDWVKRTTTMFKASKSWTGATSNNSKVSSVYGAYTSGIRPTSLGLKVKTRYY